MPPDDSPSEFSRSSTFSRISKIGLTSRDLSQFIKSKKFQRKEFSDLKSNLDVDEFVKEEKLLVRETFIEKPEDRSPLQ